MSNSAVEIQYNEHSDSLETLLSGVRRPGHFFVYGSEEMPMPKVEIESVGTLSFPIPEEQIKRMIQQAALAPYGRGDETILDTSVRKVWQLSPSQIHISGRSWQSHFNEILLRVKAGLGCQDALLTAELYKMLIYTEGCFFLPHRDTEKADGMFGTLVVVLPSFHRGGELRIRHAGHEATVDLSNDEVSALTFAAFYSDCEHELLPIKEGSRVCLVFNLIQQQRSLLTAPQYDSEIAAATEILKKTMTEADSPVKLAWLLEHQYSPAELSFNGLKNADAALVGVLSEAALAAGCAVHLGLVHIEESGSAVPEYDGYHRYRDDTCDDFEIIDVCEESQSIDGLINLEDQAADFGPLPLDAGELLPKGALDDEIPDEQRLMEATGNEGASYERSYHRAALVIWRNDRYPEVQLQAGVVSVMPYFVELVSSKPQEARSLATLIIDAWETAPKKIEYLIDKTKGPNRSLMLQQLCRLGETTLWERFMAKIVYRDYDGTENAALNESILVLNPSTAGSWLSQLVITHTSVYPGACVDLLNRLVEENIGVAHKIAPLIIDELKDIGKTYSYRARPVDFALVVNLWKALTRLATRALFDSATNAIIGRPEVFCPEKVLVPALLSLHQEAESDLHRNSSTVRLWQHTAAFFISRSFHAPEAPLDWKQKVTISCHCEDCRELQVFAHDPFKQKHFFRVRKDRRQHLHQTIDEKKMDMTHITEPGGSPLTLVCTKTRRTYEQRCKQYQADLSSMRILMSVFSEAQTETAELREKLAAAIA